MACRCGVTAQTRYPTNNTSSYLRCGESCVRRLCGASVGEEQGTYTQVAADAKHVFVSHTYNHSEWICTNATLVVSHPVRAYSIGLGMGEEGHEEHVCTWIHRSMIPMQGGGMRRMRYVGVDWPIHEGIGWATIGRNLIFNDAPSYATPHPSPLSVLPLNSVSALAFTRDELRKLAPTLDMAAQLLRNLVVTVHGP